MRHGEIERLAWIAAHVREHGTLRRADVMDRFGISRPQASIDIGKVMAASPNLMAYDMTRKCYVLKRAAKGLTPSQKRRLPQELAERIGQASLALTVELSRLSFRGPGARAAVRRWGSRR